MPDLATDTGRPSDGGKTWTFTLKDGLKYSDGTLIKAADVKWGLERSFAPAFSGGLTYHKDLLSPGLAYKGPFDGGKELDSIQTPDDEDDRLPPRPALRRLELGRQHPGVRAGAEGQGRRAELR